MHTYTDSIMDSTRYDFEARRYVRQRRREREKVAEREHADLCFCAFVGVFFFVLMLGIIYL